MDNFEFDRSRTGFLLIDVQDKLFPLVDHSCEVFKKIHLLIEGFNILDIPIWVSEQYPEGLGSTLERLKNVLKPNTVYLRKTSFSCLKDDSLRKTLLASSIDQWILAGIEAHVCVLQSAKDLIKAGKQVAVINDAISSRSIYDFSTAIAEMRDIGVRVTSTETVLFELVENSKAPEFKSISSLVKQSCCQCS